METHQVDPFDLPQGVSFDDLLTAGTKRLYGSSQNEEYIPNQFELEVFEKEPLEALKYIHDGINSGDFSLEDGEAKTFIIPKKGDGRLPFDQVLVRDVSAQCEKAPWGKDFVFSLGKTLENNYKDIVCSMEKFGATGVAMPMDGGKTPTQVMFIAGRAESVGLANKQFESACVVAGLSVNEKGQYSIADKVEGKKLLEEKLKGYGITHLHDIQNGVTELVFDSILGVPDDLKEDLIRTVVDNLTNDLRSLGLVSDSARAELQSRDDYLPVRIVKEKLGIQDEAIATLIKKGVTIARNPESEKEMLAVINKHQNLLAVVHDQMDVVADSLAFAVSHAEDFGIDPTVVGEIIKEKGFEPENFGVGFEDEDTDHEEDSENSTPTTPKPTEQSPPRPPGPSMRM